MKSLLTIWRYGQSTNLIRRKSTTWLRSLILLLAVLGLGVMLLRVAGLLPQAVAPVVITESPSPTTTQVVFVRPDIPAATTNISLTEENAELETPADQWANALLDYVLPVLNENAAPVDQLTWWYTTSDSYWAATPATRRCFSASGMPSRS